MEILLALLAVAGVLGAGPAAGPSRQAELYTVLDHAVMLREASSSRDRVRPAGRVSDQDREIDLDLMHMELATGYLERTCVYDDEAVTRMRLMIAYVGLLRLLGESDGAIEARLVAGAGEEAPRVRQFLGFAGLDGIDHFICADYMARALDAGMPAAELRGYIDDLAPDPATPPPGTATLRLAAGG